MTQAVLDRPTQPTSASFDLPPLVTDLHATGITTADAVTSGRYWDLTDLASAPPSPAVVKGTTRTLGVDERDQLFGGLLLWLAAVWMLPRRRQATEHVAMEPAEAVERLRRWTGLSVEGVAELLGVTRRSLYHWSTGTTRPRHEERLLGLVRALEPVATSWASWELRQWLVDQGARQLVRSGDMTRLRELLDDAVRPSAVRRLRPARPDYEEEVEALDTAAWHSHFLASVARRPRPSVRSIGQIDLPRELTDSPIREDE